MAVPNASPFGIDNTFPYRACRASWGFSTHAVVASYACPCLAQACPKLANVPSYASLGMGFTSSTLVGNKGITLVPVA